MKYCTNQRCGRNFSGVAREEGKNCPVCQSKIQSGFSIKTNNLKEDIGQKIGRKRMKQGLIGGLAGILATVGGFNYHNHVNSPEYLRAKDLDEKAAYIMPRNLNERSEYELGEKNKVAVFVNANDGRRLNIEINDQIRFVSEWYMPATHEFTWGSSDGDAKFLDGLAIKINDGWVNLPRNEIQDYESWQKLYEVLIDRLAEIKSTTTNQDKIVYNEEKLNEAKRKLLDLSKKLNKEVLGPNFEATR